MPRGGRRPGAGRKPAPDHLQLIKNTRTRSKAAPSAPDAAVPDRFAPVPPTGDILTAPTYLTDPGEVAMWNELAPLAFAQRTLTPATVRSLTVLCRVVLLEQKLANLSPGGSEHRGTLQRMNALMLQFSLTPCGKPLFEAAKDEPEKKTGLARFLKRA